MAGTQENLAERAPDDSLQTEKKLERATKRRERGTRTKRMILVGSLASFLGFFGLSMAAEPFTGTQTGDTQPPAIVAPSDHDEDEDEGPAFFNGQPQIRTRTS